MPFSGTVAIRAMKDGDYQATTFAGTTAGLQSAIDYLAGGKGEVRIGPGTLETSTAIWLHSGTKLTGSGRGKTVIKRASGSITDSDAANSGAVLASSAYGANGTLSNSAATVSNIEIADLTVDGNQSAFSSLTSGTPHQAGILIQSCDGLRVHSVTVQNTLRSGYMLIESRNVTLTDTIADTVGQFSVVTTRNAYDFYNYNAATSGYGVKFNVHGFRVYNVGDEAFSLTNVSDVSISGGVIDGCDMCFELQGSNNTSSDGNISIADVAAKNILSECLIIHGNTSGHDYYDVVMHNCTFECHATLHDTRVLAVEPSTSNSVTGIRVSNCTFRNVNSKDTNARAWVDLTSNTGTNYRDISVIGCSFYGLSGSTRTTDSGVELLSTNVSDITIKNCLFKNVPGRGVRIHDTTSSSTRNVRIESVTVDTSTSVGFQLAGEKTSTSIKNVYFVDCIAKDTNTGTGDSAFQVICSSSSTAPAGIYFVDCLAYKTSGTTMEYGLDLQASTGSMANIVITNCEFVDVQTRAFRYSGLTATNVHFSPRPGRGTDIASAATITIPQDGDVFHVTGTTNITNGVTVKAWDNGRTIRLIFEGILTMTDTGTSVLQGNFTSAADDVLCLTCDGTNWYEVSRN